MKQQECFHITGKNENGMAPLENWQFLEKLNQKFIIQPSQYTHRCFPNKTENTCSHKDLNNNVHSSFIETSQKLKGKKGLSIGEWINKI